jgi:hypothetical protein
MGKITINVYKIFIGFDKETLRLVGGCQLAVIVCSRALTSHSCANFGFFSIANFLLNKNLLLEILSLEKALHLHTTNNHLTIL